MNAVTVTAPAWTNGHRTISVEELHEGLHFIYDAPIAGHWVTTRGVPNEAIEA